MIIWQGLGFLVVLIPVAFLIAALALVFAVDKPDFIFFGSGFAMLLTAMTIWTIGKKLSSSPGKVLIDPETNQEIEFKSKHTLFWIPMQWFAIPAVLIALAFFSLHFL